MHSFLVPALVACTTLLAACSDGNGSTDNNGGTGSGATGSGGTTATGGTGATGSGGTSGTTSNGTVQLTQDNNFKVTMSSLTIPPVTVAEGADVNVCWDKVTKDFQGHPLAPSDIEQVSFVPVKGTQAQVGDWLNTGQLGNDKIAGNGAYTLFPTAGQTCAKLSTFPPASGTGNLAPATAFKIQDGVTYLIVFAHGKQLGYGARTMLYLVPSSQSVDEAASAQPDSSTMLVFKADLQTLKHVPVTASTPPIVDWGGVKTNGQGIAIGNGDISSILIGFYKGKTVTDLETGFLNLDQLTEAMGGPTQSWQVSVPSGHTAGLAGAKGRNNEPAFASFTPTDGIWLLGMFCSSCQNPAPEIVTILDPQ